MLTTRTGSNFLETMKGMSFGWIFNGLFLVFVGPISIDKLCACSPGHLADQEVAAVKGPSALEQ